MNTVLNNKIHSLRVGHCVRPIRFAENWESGHSTSELPALSDKNVSKIFRRDRALHNQRNGLDDKRQQDLRSNFLGLNSASATHTNFFEWALGKLH